MCIRDRLKPYIQSILDADASYNNTLDSLKKDKENADLNHQISQLQLEEYEESGTSRQAEMQELIVKQNELCLLYTSSRRRYDYFQGGLWYRYYFRRCGK